MKKIKRQTILSVHRYLTVISKYGDAFAKIFLLPFFFIKEGQNVLMHL